MVVLATDLGDGNLGPSVANAAEDFDYVAFTVAADADGRVWMLAPV